MKRLNFLDGALSRQKERILDLFGGVVATFDVDGADCRLLAIRGLYAMLVIPEYLGGDDDDEEVCPGDRAM